MSERMSANEVLQSIRAREQALRDRFQNEAIVTNQEKGYISVPWINQLVDVGYQEFAADLIAYKYNGTKFDKVVGIPNSGIPLATTVAQKLRVPLAPGRKGLAAPGSWKEPIIVHEDTPSFTTGEASQFVFNGIYQGDKVLLVDDVIALGATTEVITSEFQKHDIDIELAVYMSKTFQPGVDNLANNMGIIPFSVIEVESIEEGAIKLSTPHF